MERLEDLFGALHNAVLEAQKLTEQQHLRQFRRYFEESKSGLIPIMLPISIPDVRPDSGESYRTIDVPLIVLSPPTAMKIKDLQIRFQVQLSGLSDKAKGIDPVSGKEKVHPGDVEMDFGGEGANVATVDITFDQAEMPEAYHRITELLSKKIPWS